MPRKSACVYVFGSEAFVPHPAGPGLWIRTHVSAVLVPCERCGAAVGAPCKSKTGWVGWTHYHRRNAAKKVVATQPKGTMKIIRS